MGAIGNVFAIHPFKFGESKTWAEVATITTAEQTVEVPGLRVGDFVHVEKPTEQAGLGIGNVRVSAANTLAIQFINPTAAGITPTASEAWRGVLMRPELPLQTNANI